MFWGFLISSEKGGMEDGVDLPSRGDVEAEGHAGDNFLHFEWTSLFHLELLGSVHVEVCSFKPDLISYLPWSELGGYSFFHFLLSVTVRWDPYPFPWSCDTMHMTSLQNQHDLLTVYATSQDLRLQGS